MKKYSVLPYKNVGDQKIQRNRQENYADTLN